MTSGRILGIAKVIMLFLVSDYAAYFLDGKDIA
jgi:hypothetical protein